MVTYEPFDLMISPAADGYQVRVIASPHGEAAGTFLLPPAIATLNDNLQLVGGAIRAFKLAGTSPTAIQPLDPQRFGEQLFTALFQGNVGQCLRQSMAVVEQTGKGLRLRLRLDEAPELAALPWEYLYDPINRRYLVLSDQTSVVRYLALPQGEIPLAVQGALRILVLTADANDYAKLDVAAEASRLRTALQPLEDKGDVAITWLLNGTLSTLRQALRRNEYHIFHFIGHGWFTDHEDNGLLLVDEAGDGLQVSAETLGVNLHNHRSLRLAFLNACEGARLAGVEGEPFAGVAQHLVQQGLPAVIAMQFPVSDHAAIELTREFYTAIADRYPVDQALTQARIAIYSQESVMEWGTPVLFMRSADGRLWQSTDDKEEQSTPPRAMQINTAGGTYIGGEFVGRDKISGHKADGDVIVTTIGAGAKNVAVGKSNKQTVTEIAPQVPDADQRQVMAALEKLMRAVNAIGDQRIAVKAEVHVETLQQELTKSVAKVNGGAVTNAVEWLLTNAPVLAPVVNELLTLPTMQQMMTQTDTQTVAWWRRWLP